MILAKAVRSNPRYAVQLGWITRMDQITRLLNFNSMSPNPEDFARAVERWQRSRRGLTPDGMIGPRTWRVMEPLTRFNSGNGLIPPGSLWIISGGGGSGSVVAPGVANVDAAPPVHRAPGSPPPAGVTMRHGGLRHRRYEEAFTDTEMAQHGEYMEMLSAARTLGRTHATLMALAANPPEAPRAWHPGLSRVPYTEERQQYDEAIQDGRLVLTNEGGRSRYVSTISRSREFQDLELFYGQNFLDEFNQAVRDQWQFLQEKPVVEGIELIAELLITWGIAAVERRVTGAAVRAAVENGVTRLGAICRRITLKCRSFILRVTEKIKNALTRLTGGRRDVRLILCPRTGRTLRGLGPELETGTLDTLPDIGNSSTLPDIGNSPTLPAPTGGASPLPTSHPLGAGQAGSVSGELQAIPFTHDEAVAVWQISSHPTASISRTWGTSPSMVESYEAKWIQYGMTGPPPANGFKVMKDGSLQSIIIHFSEHPWELGLR